MSNEFFSNIRKTARKMAARTKLGGFTLAELIVVVTILAILATVGFLTLSGYSQDAKDARVKTNVRSVYSAISTESVVSGNSPRYYVIHDSGAALSWGIVFVSGNPTVLTGGDWNVVWTNYSAGNPDYVKLKLNPEKFRIASAFGIFKIAEAAFDAKQPVVWAADMTEAATGARKTRSIGYVQVVGAQPSGSYAVVGNYPTTVSGSVSGLVKDPASSSQTGAVVEGGAASTSTTSGPVSVMVSSNSYDYNMFVAAGSPSGPVSVTVTIAPGTVFWATSTSNYAFDTGTGWAAGSTLKLVVWTGAYVSGRGGNGGWVGRSYAGDAGGPAFRAQFPISVTNFWTIQWGGGGGGSRPDLSWGGGGGGAGADGWVGWVGGWYDDGQWPNGRLGTLTAWGIWGFYYGGGGGWPGAAGAASATIGPQPGWAGWAAVTGNANVTWTAAGAKYGAIN